VDVTLVERDGLAGGTSGRSHGLLHSGARYANDDAAGARECIEENRVLRDVAGACIRDTDGLFVQLAEDDPDHFDAKLAACRDLDVPATVLPESEARERVSGLADDVARVMEVPDAVVYPSRLVAANAADARDHGATVLTDAPVEGVQVTDGRVSGVELGGSVGDVVEADYVVNAAGAWAGEVAELAGVDVEMRPTRGVMVSVAYDGLGPVLNRSRDADDGDIIVPHDDQVVLGTTSVEVDDPDEYPQEQWEVDTVVAECARMLPAVSDAEFLRTWWGVRPLYEPDEAARGGRGISRGFFRLDHAEDGVENLVSVVGGKLTTYRLMAEQTADLVADRLGVESPCVTADRTLPGADDPERLDAFVREFGGRAPTDEDVVRRD
jgi:glycerol-3-phosphate dehydrogenase